jgi:hypothetical protein
VFGMAVLMSAQLLPILLLLVVCVRNLYGVRVLWMFLACMSPSRAFCRYAARVMFMSLYICTRRYLDGESK